jgi:hypothetical protein
VECYERLKKKNGGRVDRRAVVDRHRLRPVRSRRRRTRSR